MVVSLRKSCGIIPVRASARIMLSVMQWRRSGGL